MKLDLNSAEMIIESWKSSNEQINQKVMYAFCQNEIEERPSITFTDTKEIFQFNSESGVYEPAETKIEERIQELFGEKAKKFHVNEMLATIQRLTYKERKETNNPTLIPLSNGYFDLNDDQFKKYEPQIIFFSKHPIHYNFDAQCPKIISFLEQVTENDAKKKELLIKIAAYCFYRSYPIQKAIMLIGTGANGKSVYLNLLRNLLGDHNVVSQTLQRLSEDRFATAQLYQKNANIFADLETKALKNTGIFKSLTGGDYLTCDRKYKDPFDFLNYAKLLFSCNQMPSTSDESDAFYRRWIIVEFNRTFQPEEQNPQLIEELTNPNELSGFFNEIVPFIHQILKEKKIDIESIESLRERYTKNSDSAKSFCYEKIELAPLEFETKERLFNEYLKYCKQNNLPTKDNKRFYKAVYLFFEGQVYESRQQVFGYTDRVRVLKGLKIKDASNVSNESN